MKEKLVELPFDIPILDEHPLMDQDSNKVLVNLTPARLQKIVDNNNRRIKETGDLVPLVIGHTKDGLSETKQPPIVGFATKFKVAPFKKGKKAIFCRYLVYESQLDLVRKYPRRSVELWLSRMEIDPISLLGATTPDRDLGLVRFHERGDSYHREIDNTMDPTNETVQAVLAALKETAEWKLLGQLVEEMKAPAGNEEQPPEGDPNAAAAVPAENAPPSMGEQPPETPVKTDEEPAQMSAATASGNNTSIPGQQKVQYSAETQVLVSRMNDLATENKALREGLNQQVRLSRRHTREKDLIRLQEGQNYDLDVAEELDEPSLDLSDDQWNKKLDRIKKRYQRAPVGGQRLPIIQDGDMPDASRKALVERARDKALKTGRSFTEVFDELKGN